jgi:glycosyltransferase involved in cell wall biosynthesis
MTRGIVHLTTYLQGGAGRAITDLARAQRVAGHEVLVVASRDPRGEFANYPHYLDQLDAAGVPYWLEDSLFVRDAATTQRVAARLRAGYAARDIAILHAHAGVPARIALAAAVGDTRRPAVLQTQHGWGANKTAEQAGEDLRTLANVDAVLVTSKATHAQLAALGVPASSMTVVPCGLATDAPPPSRAAHAAAAALRARGRVVVGCVGSVTANKNQEAVVRAVARSARRPLAAVIVGEGSDRLAATCRAEGAQAEVHLAGYQPDAAAWVAAFDVLVVPSLTEGQGLVVLEAFRAGVPVVASDIPALRELVEEGHTGWLCDPRDPESIVAAVDRARSISNERHRQVLAAARAVFDRDYTTATMVARHEAAYATAIERTCLSFSL